MLARLGRRAGSGRARASEVTSGTLAQAHPVPPRGRLTVCRAALTSATPAGAPGAAAARGSAPPQRGAVLLGKPNVCGVTFGFDSWTAAHRYDVARPTLAVR